MLSLLLFLLFLTFLLQIPRNDPCEMCVCVDSEMFCFWKLCAFLESTTVKPLTSISPINYQQENHSNVDRQSALVKLNANDVQSNEVVETNEKYAKILTDQRKYNLLKKLETTSSKNSVTGENTSTESSTTLTVEPAVCYVMGQ